MRKHKNPIMGNPEIKSEFQNPKASLEFYRNIRAD